MNQLTLDPHDERFSALAGCAEGETVTLTVSGTVARAEDGTFTLAVDKLDYEVEAEPLEAGEPAKPMKAAKGGPDHPAVMLLVAKKPAKA